MIKDKQALAARETELNIAYRFIKKGSIKPADRRSKFGEKITVVAVCKKCKHERRLSTSDLFQSLCPACGHRYNPHYGS